MRASFPPPSLAVRTFAGGLALVVALAGSARPLEARQAQATAPGPSAERSASAVERTARGEHFRVRVHFDAQPVADELLAAAEAVVPFARELHGDARIAPDALPEIHVYLDEASWRRVEAQSAGGTAQHVPRGTAQHAFAFDDPAASTAHVAALPPASAELLAQVGAPLAWKRLVAHEAVHLWSFRAAPRASALPFWFAEGAAQSACERALRSRHWTSEPLEDPFTATQALAARALAQRDWLPSASAVIDGLPGGLTFHERYAVAAVLFEFLRAPEHRALLDGLCAAARAATADAAPKTEPQAALSQALDRALGTQEALDAFDAAFLAHARALKPGWDEGFGSLWAIGDGWAHAAFADTNALAWRTSPCGTGPYEVAGDVAILPGESQQMNVLLARSEHVFVQVAFTADFGVDVLEFDARRSPDASWRKLATARAEGFGAGAFHRFRIVVEAPTISVWLDDKPLCAPRLEGYDLSGAFGLGALARTSGLWRKIALRRL